MADLMDKDTDNAIRRSVGMEHMRGEDDMSIKPEMKKQNRFILDMVDTGIQPWVVQKVTKPKYGKDGWTDIQIELVDPISPSSSIAVYEGIINNFKRNNLRRGREKLFIHDLDPVGYRVQTWEIDGHYGDIDFGDSWSYDTGEFSKIIINFEVIQCKIKYPDEALKES